MAAVVDNLAPGLGLANTTNTLSENTAVAVDRKIADLNIVDDEFGINVTSLSGPDASFFKIIGGALYLKAGTMLDYEVKPSYTPLLSTSMMRRSEARPTHRLVFNWPLATFEKRALSIAASTTRVRPALNSMRA